jgi:hypothetical protein
MATELSQKGDPLFLSDPMATYNHMEEENNGQAMFTGAAQSGQTRVLWTVVLEETLIAALTLSLLWVSIG